MDKKNAGLGDALPEPAEAVRYQKTNRIPSKLTNHTVQRKHFERQVDHLHGLGPRCFGEFLLALADADPATESRVQRLLNDFETLTPDMVKAVRADRWPPLPIHEVAA